MFVIKDTIDKAVYELNDIKDAIDVISSWANEKTLTRYSIILGSMSFGETFTGGRYVIRCVNDELFHKKIWLDAESPAPEGFYRAMTVNQAKNAVAFLMQNDIKVDCVSIGNEIPYERQCDGGKITDFLRFVKELEEKKYSVPVVSHSPSGFPPDEYKRYSLRSVDGKYYPFKARPYDDAEYYFATSYDNCKTWTIGYNGHPVDIFEGDFYAVVDRLEELNKNIKPKIIHN